MHLVKQSQGWPHEAFYVATKPALNLDRKIKKNVLISNVDCFALRNNTKFFSYSVVATTLNWTRKMSHVKLCVFFLLTATFPTIETDFQCQEIQKVSSTGEMLNNKKAESVFCLFWCKLSLITLSRNSQ